MTYLKQEIEALFKKASLNTKQVLNVEEASEYTGLSTSTLYKLTSSRRIPHSKPSGKKVFFSREALDEWMLKNPVSCLESLDQKASNIMLNLQNPLML